MSIMNRRNAMLGWAVWKIASNVAKTKAKRAVPKPESSKPRWAKRAAAVAIGFAATTGAAIALRKALSGDDAPPVV
jgi:hypothetical protein